MYHQLRIDLAIATKDTVEIVASGVHYSIFKKDLGTTKLHRGDEIGVTELLGYEGVVAHLDVNGERIFTKPRRDVAVEHARAAGSKSK